MFAEVNRSVNQKGHGHHVQCACNYCCLRRNYLAWPLAGRGHSGDCAVDKANHCHIQSDHGKVQQGHETSRQNKMIESHQSSCNSPFFWSTLITSPMEREMTTTLKVISISACCSKFSTSSSESFHQMAQYDFLRLCTDVPLQEK